MAAALEGGAMGATDLADHLVREGWPFRRAHEAVGSLVRSVLDRGADLPDATPEEIASSGLAGVALPSLTAEACVESKAVPGGTARVSVAAQLDAARAEVAGW
jgi:argininosuccinate lyase